MKLKNFAALIFRLLGAMGILEGIAEAQLSLFDKESRSSLGNAIGGIVVSLCLIIFSKRLGALFCKGLDDDAP
jgi:hypothetical protein